MREYSQYYFISERKPISNILREVNSANFTRKPLYLLSYLYFRAILKMVLIKLTRDLIHAVQKLLIFTSIKFREFRKMRFLIIFAVANFCENEIILPKVNSLKVYMEKYDIITTNLSYQE